LKPDDQKKDKRRPILIERNKNNYEETYRELALVLAALLALTAITVTVSRINLGAFKIAASLTIASVKATIVLIFFMHIRQAGRAIVIAFIVTLVILAIFIGFTFFDIAYR
jgi:cytochrome c oxidase subunit IV